MTDPVPAPSAASVSTDADATAAALDAGSGDADGARSSPSLSGAVAEVIVASGFPTQLALGALLALGGLLPFDGTGQLSMEYLVLLMPADTVLIVAFVVWRLRAGGERVSAIFLGDRPWARECWLGAGLIPLVLGGVALFMTGLRAAWPALHNVDANPFESLITSRLDALLLGVLVIITGGVKEEVQRAFVLHRFGQRLGGARLGLVLYSLVFGTGHVIQGYDVAIVTALLGLGWGAVFLWRRSLVAASVSHAGFNATQVLQFALFGG